jgi:tetratricopeptide (TPR) repeat protein
MATLHRQLGDQSPAEAPAASAPGRLILVDADDGEAPTPDPLLTSEVRFRRPRRGSACRWCIAPPVSRPRGETLEAVHVLDEHDDTSVALLLWATMRDVLVWAGVEQGRREGMFSAGAAQRRRAEIKGAGLPPAVEVPLLSLATLLSRPERGNASEIALVCMTISRWSRDHGARGTAIEFARTAAAVEPDDPGPAISTGALLRGSASDDDAFARAGTWLRLAISLGRRRGDWLRYAEAFVELGAMYARQEDPDRAARMYVRAARAAQRHGLREVRGAAHHGMMRLMVNAGRLEEAAQLGQRAARNYGKGHQLRAAVMHDLAALWIQMGEYARAVPVLRRHLEHHRITPRQRALTFAILAHGEAGLGEERRDAYRAAWDAAWTIIHAQGADDENHARALLQLASASHLLKDWGRMDAAVGAQGEKRHADRRVAAQIAELLTYGKPGSGVEP